MLLQPDKLAKTRLNRAIERVGTERWNLKGDKVNMTNFLINFVIELFYAFYQKKALAKNSNLGKVVLNLKTRNANWPRKVGNK
jgi:hypothetical protein